MNTLMNKNVACRTLICFLCFCFVLVASTVLVLAAGGGKENNTPIGEMISNGDVSFEAKGKRWARPESTHFPVFKGMKVKTGRGTAVITLTSNSQIEVAQNSELSLTQEDQISISQGTVNFRIPLTAQTKVIIGDLSVMRSPHLQASKSDAPIFQKMEETIGTVYIRPNGSLVIKSERGSISVIDKNRNVLASLPSHDSVTFPSAKVFGQGKVMVAQAGDVLTPQQKMMQKQVEATLGVHPEEADLLEDYLIDFSKALKGKSLPTDLDAEKFFAVLEKHYTNQEAINEVKQYHVEVKNDEDSYDIVICDKQHKWRLYRDLGKTTDYVEYPYWPERKEIECQEGLVPPLAVAIWEGEIFTFAILFIRDHDDDKKPICP
jgi:hypothetical protein